MEYFLYKLIPPRPTFPQDMSEEEGKVMQEHISYWQNLAERKIALIFGPVLDPSGIYGIAIIQVDDAAGVQALSNDDPVIKARLGFRSEYYPIHEPILRQLNE